MQPLRSLLSALLISVLSAALTACVTPSAPPASPARAAAIVLDGSFGDWEAVEPVIVDPIDAPDGFVDFGAVSVAHDQHFVHLLIDFGRDVNPQGLDGTGHVLLDVDGDEITGETMHGLPGVDLIVELTPPNKKSTDRPGRGVGLRVPIGNTGGAARAADTPNPYDIEFSFAPTYASRRVEFRMRRGTAIAGVPPLFSGDHFNGKLVYEERGTIVDVTDDFTHTLTSAPRRPLPPVQTTDPLAKADGVLRVVSWNGEWGALFTKPEPFMRTFRVLDPDVILLQELKSNCSRQALENLFNTRLPLANGQRWHSAFGEGGGNLRCGVVSRFPLRDAGPLSLVSYPSQPHRQVRIVGTMVAWHEMHVLVASLHLKCCGRKGSSEDKKRMVEVRLIGDALAETCATEDVNAVIIGGDFNLVGARAPLDALLIGRDLDGSSLKATEPLQLDRLSNATWQNPKQPFAPGRLDFVVHGDGALESTRSFVYDSRDLAPQWLDHHEVSPGDVLDASDHQPVVVDFRRRDRMGSKRTP